MAPADLPPDSLQVQRRPRAATTHSPVDQQRINRAHASTDTRKKRYKRLLFVHCSLLFAHFSFPFLLLSLLFPLSSSSLLFALFAFFALALSLSLPLSFTFFKASRGGGYKIMVGCRSYTDPSIQKKHLYTRVGLLGPHCKKSGDRVDLWARPPVLTHATKTSSSTVESRLCSSGAPPTPTTTRHPEGTSPSQRDRPSHCPPRHRGHAAGGSSRSSQSQWQPLSPSLRRVTCHRSCGPLRPLSGVGEISGHAILQLQNTNDLAALRCMSAEIADLPRSESQDGWVCACSKFHHFDIQSIRGDVIWLPSRGSRLLLPFLRACLNFSPR